MSGNVTTQDLTQGGPAVLVALINSQNLIYLPTPLTVAAITYNDPSPYIGAGGATGANTVITVGTNAPATYGAGTVNVHYMRADISQIPAQQPALSGSNLTIANVLSAINAAYQLDLAQANVTQTVTTPLTANGDGSYTQQITTVGNDLIYTGTQTFTFKVPAPVPVASFTSSANYLAATFTDTSTDANGTIHAWAWTFGDGNTASVQNPTHTYAANGTYTVTLTITDADGTSTSFVSNPITVAAIVPTVTALFTESSSGYTATFTDASTDVNGTIATWLWNFGDGNTSTSKNPTHKYAAVGNYTVTLTVTDANGTTSANSSKLIGISAPVVTASFTDVVTHLSAAMTDTSTDVGGTITSWLWNFGDSQTSTAQNPTHVYAASGSYTVKLTVTDADGITSSSSSTIINPAAPAIVANFTSAYGSSGLAVSFTDTSTDPSSSIASWHWDFGDDVATTIQNPSHTYAEAGTYSVVLTVTDSDGVTTSSKTESIVADASSVTAAFTDAVSELQVTFTDTSTATGATVASWLWNFGDGNTSTVQNPVHAYATAGTYTVQLTVTDSLGHANSTVSHSVTALSPLVTAAFTSAPTGLAVNFTDTSTDVNGTLAAWLWDFGDSNTATTQNPSHTYAANGTYTVHLTVTDTDGHTTSNVSHSLTVSGAVVTANFTDSINALEVTFTDTSTVTGGTIATWAWTFGDGNTSSTESPTHTYAAAGTYTVQLTATDATGVVSNSKSASVTVS